MPDIADASTQQLLRAIVREETDDIRVNVGDIKTDISGLKTDVTSLKSDMIIVKEVQGGQGILLRTIQSGVNNLKSSFRVQVSEVRKLGVLYEDLEHSIQAAAEID